MPNLPPLLLFTTLSTLLLTITPIQIPLHDQPRCMILSSTFQVNQLITYPQPIKVQIQFPSIPNKLQGQQYKVTLLKLLTQQVVTQQFIQGEFLFRKNYKLSSNTLYNLCIEIIKVRSYFQPQEQVYVNYIATEDFETLIGKIEIPPELLGQDNLQSIYKVAKQLTSLNKVVLDNQRKQRQLEDQLVSENVHKNERIYVLTIVECLVIVLSGVYQVFALRKFLIDKNLY